MPTVPEDQITQTLRPLDDTPLQAANFQAGSEQVAQAAGGFGQSVKEYADADYQRAEVVSTAAAKQAESYVRAANVATLYGDDTTPGYTSLRGGNALTGRKDAEDALRRNASDAIGTVDDPRTKRMVTAVVEARLADGLSTVAKHYNEQSLIYGKQQSVARQADATDQAVSNYADPDQFTVNLGVLKSEVHDQASTEGWSDAEEVRQIKAATDGVYRGVVEKIAAAGDSIGAAHYLDLHRDVISQSTQLILDQQLRAHVADQDARQLGDGAGGIGYAPQIGPNPTSTMRDAYVTGTVQAESGGRPGLRSPAGALGTMQVMPATAMAWCAKNGVAYDEHRLQFDAEYCNRIGRGIQNDNLAYYGGNATLATAAYNAGRGNVDKWIAANGDPRTGAISDASWAAKIPFKETRDYVPRVLRATATAAGVEPSAATSPAPTIDLETGIANIRASGKPLDVQDKAIGYLRQRFADHQAAVVQVQKAAYDTVLPGLRDGSIKALSQIDPKTFSDMSTEQQTTATTIIAHNATGKNAPPNNPVFLSAIKMAATDPTRFANTDLTPLLGQIPRSDWNTLQDRQATIITHGATAPKAVTYQNIDKIVSDLAPGAGLVLGKPKSGVPTAPASPVGADMATRLRAMHDGIQVDVDTYHAQNKKWPTLEEVQAMGARRMTQVTLPGTGGWFSGDKSALYGEVPSGTRYTLSGANVPALARSQIVSAYSARWGRAPSDGEIAAIFSKGR